MGPMPWRAALLAALLIAPTSVLAEPVSDTNPPAETPAPLQLPNGWQIDEQLLDLPDWVDLGINVTAEPMANPLGGERQRAGWMGQTSLVLDVGPGLTRPQAQWREPDHWQLNLTLNHYTGDPTYSLDIGALFPLQQIAYPSGALLSEASLTRNAGDGWLELKGGILPLNPDFISSPIFDLYVHSSFNDTLNIALNGLPISPYAAFGGTVAIQPSPDLQVRYGWFNLSSTEPLAEWLGSPRPFVGIADGSAQLLQLSWSPAALGADADTPIQACRTARGVVRHRPSCQHTIAVANQLPGGLIQLGGFHTSSQSRGLYGSATLRSGVPLGLDDRIWIGGALSGGQAGAISPSFLAAGLVVQGIIPDRPFDLLLLAAGRAGLQQGSVPDWTSTYEAMVELGYQVRLNNNLMLQPTVQWILNPSADPQPVPGILAAGLQLIANF